MGAPTPHPFTLSLSKGEPPATPVKQEGRQLAALFFVPLLSLRSWR